MGSDLSIVSAQNILSKGGQLNTTVSDATGGNGGNLTLVAGANFTVDGSMNIYNDYGLWQRRQREPNRGTD